MNSKSIEKFDEFYFCPNCPVIRITSSPILSDKMFNESKFPYEVVAGSRFYILNVYGST